MVASTLFLSTSCGTTKASTTKSMDIYGSGVIQKPVVVDLNVSQTRVNGYAKEGSSESLETIKQKAINDALKKANADVLIEPKFDIETKNGSTTAVVSGWPATYNNFRSITAEDIPLLEAGVLQKAEAYAPPLTEKKSKALVFLGTLLIVGASVGLAAILNPGY